MIGLNKIGLNQVQLNQLYLNTLCACQKSSGGDGFPHLRGDVTRWSFKGLTNEQMSKNPRLEDADHKGRFLTFKNFAWSGMSGCNGYDYNFMGSSFAIIGPSHGTQRSSDKVVILKANNGQANFMYSASVLKCRIRITSVSKLVENGDVTSLDIWGYNERTKFSTKADGIYDIDLSAESGIFYFMARSPKGTVEEPLILSSPITIELLPYYPGFIIGDGVDDYAVTEKNLDFEDTYTVYTAFIPFQEDLARNMVLCGKNNKKDFYMNYSTLNSINFYSSSKAATVRLNNGFNLIICKRTTDKMIIKNLLTNVSIEIDANAVSENPGLYYLWRSLNNATYANAAIAGQVICNGHFTTDEEDTKVLNWYKKEYPWLFFDQAWTVTGKTNEDTDRATIANITGNDNNLALQNFGFIEGSGYNEEGEYAGYLVTDGVDDIIRSSAFTVGKDWTTVGEWEFLKEDAIKIAGIAKFNSFRFYNYSFIGRMNVYINSDLGTNVIGESVKAATSKGSVYLDFNSVTEVTPGDEVDLGQSLFIGYNVNNFTKLAFKNLAIYSAVLSKEDMIKAYIYLQTLKAK